MIKIKIKIHWQRPPRLLNENAPEGESLAYINQDEAKMLKDAGGAGEPVNSSGVPSYFLQKLFGGGKAPPPMPKFDVGQITTDYVKAMSSPKLQGQLLETRQTYDPQYQDLQISLAREPQTQWLILPSNKRDGHRSLVVRWQSVRREVIYLYLIALVRT